MILIYEVANMETQNQAISSKNTRSFDVVSPVVLTCLLIMVVTEFFVKNDTVAIGILLGVVVINIVVLLLGFIKNF